MRSTSKPVRLLRRGDFQGNRWNVAATADGVTKGSVDERSVERLTCAQMQANRANRSLENSLQVRMTGCWTPLRGVLKRFGVNQVEQT